MRALSKKIVMMGSFAVGKTSLVRRFVHDAFDDAYLSTLGVKVSKKTVTLSDARLMMMLWDISGREGFEHLRASYLKGAGGALLVADVTRPRTFETIAAEARSLHEVAGPVPTVIAVNKSDLVPAVSKAEIDAIAGRLGAPWLPTSALTGDAVEQAFSMLGRAIVGA